MNDKKVFELMKKPGFEYLSGMIDTNIFIFPPRIEKYLKDSDQISFNNETISKNFIKDLLSSEDSYNLILKLFSDELGSFAVYFYGEKGEFIEEYHFRKSSLMKSLTSVKEELMGDLLDKYNKLADIMSYDNYFSNHINDAYETEIDGELYSINVKDIYDLLNKDDKEYNKMIRKPQLYGIPTAKFIFCLVEYFFRKGIKENYIVSDVIKDRVLSLVKSEVVDIEALDKFDGFYDPNYKKIEVSSELKKCVFEGMPDDFSELEKAIYIYIKMCKILTYDEEFYALKQGGCVAYKHEDINHVKEITPENNKVVCYEFNAIYEKLIGELGIHFEVSQSVRDGFGGVHASLKFRSGKFIIKADSVTSILSGDIMQAKLNQPLKGLICLNMNAKTQVEFKHMITNVYKEIASIEEKKTSNEVEKIESFDDILKQYCEVTDNIKEVSLEEKMDILVRKANSTKLVGIDALSYIIQLRKVLFTSRERLSNFQISVIRDSGINNQNEYASANAIFSLRKKGEKKDLMSYYFYTPGQNLRPINRDDLERFFETGILGYVDNDDPKVPGIVGGIKR